VSDSFRKVYVSTKLRTVLLPSLSKMRRSDTIVLFSDTTRTFCVEPSRYSVTLHGLVSTSGNRPKIERGHIHFVVKVHGGIEILDNRHGWGCGVGRDELGEGITSNTTHSVTTRDELDHLRLVEALLPEALGQRGNVVLWLWCSLISSDKGIHSSALKGNNRSSAGGYCVDGPNSNDISS
jgi:hypothetical protein